MNRNLPPITRSEIAKLEASGHCVYIYPRLREASIDGFKRYRVVGGTIKVAIDTTPTTCSVLDAGPV